MPQLHQNATPKESMEAAEPRHSCKRLYAGSGYRVIRGCDNEGLVRLLRRGKEGGPYFWMRSATRELQNFKYDGRLKIG